MNLYSGKVYESEAMRKVCGDTLRPGGSNITKRAVEYSKLKPGSMILDVGCGTGASVKLLIQDYGMNAMGIDPSEKMLEIGMKHDKKLPLITGRAEHLPSKDGSLDAVLSECSLSHVSERRIALQEFHRVLKKDGFLILSDLYIRRIPEKRKKSGVRNPSSGRTTREILLHDLEQCGFKELLFEDHTNELTQLFVDIIMRYGTLADFLKEVYGDQVIPCDESDEPDVKYGYFLLIAKKEK